jgi:tripartite-type tricarboxylate transporter receptor subunit TctC
MIDANNGVAIASHQKRQSVKAAFSTVSILLLAVIVMVCGKAAAQTFHNYPSKTIRIVVPFAAGGTVDASARVVAGELAKSFRVPVVVDNRAGGGGVVGTSEVAKAPADGYALLFGSPIPILLATRKDLSFTWESFVAVAPVNKFGHVLAVASTFPVKTLSAFIAYAKENPGKLNYGTTGFGAVTHLGTELFAQAFGIRAIAVPFRGNNEALTALLAGDVQFLLLSPFFALPQYNAGKIVVLANMGAERSPFFRGVPAMGELAHPDLVVEARNGFDAPAGTPSEIIEKLNQQIHFALRDPKVGSKLAEMYTEVEFGSPQDYTATNLAEINRWKEVIRKAGIQLQ